MKIQVLLTFILIVSSALNVFASVEKLCNLSPKTLFLSKNVFRVQDSIKDFQSSLINQGISKRQANYLISRILFYFETLDQKVLNDISSSNFSFSSFPAIKKYIINEETQALSIVLFNNQIVRIKKDEQTIKYVFLKGNPEGNLEIEDWDRIVSKRDDLFEMYADSIKNGLKLSDINENMQLMIKGVQPFEEERAFKKDEILFILSSINQKLLDNGYAVDEIMNEADPIDFYLSAEEEKYLPHDLSVLPVRINELKTLLELFESDNFDSGYKLYLARDALSAMELENYYCTMAQVPQFSKAIYQPGQMKKGSYHAGFKEAESLARTMFLINRIFSKVVTSMNVEKIEEKQVMHLKGRKRTYTKDETDPDPDKYNKLKSEFKKELINALEDTQNNYLRKETLLILSQLKKTLPRCRKMTVIDLHATGKTALYIQSLIDIFSDEKIVENLKSKFKIFKEYQEGFLSIEDSSVFLGYGRAENVGIPKLSHYNKNEEQALFLDSPWSFNMENRDSEGEVLFKNNDSRYKILYQIYQSLQLFNTAYEMLGAKGYNNMDETENISERSETIHAKENLSHVNSKVQFMKIYKKNGNLFYPGYLGKQRKQVQEKLNTWFGKNQWQFMYRLPDGSLISYEAGVDFYQKAYEKYFDENPEILTNLVENYRNVYDVSPEHVTGSDKDFEFDLTSGSQAHIQDVAIRRIIRDKGLKFKGNKLLQIRGRKTQGYHLNPGVVPFHKPELINRIISDKMYRKWWDKNSVEDFYQSNRVVVLKKDLPIDININKSGHTGSSS